MKPKSTEYYRARWRLWYWLCYGETLFGISKEHMQTWELLVDEIFKTDPI